MLSLDIHVYTFSLIHMAVYWHVVTLQYVYVSHWVRIPDSAANETGIEWCTVQSYFNTIRSALPGSIKRLSLTCSVEACFTRVVYSYVLLKLLTLHITMYHMQGDMCERCAEGFTRSPVGYLSPASTCQPCDCSGQSCDPITGHCLCTGNTTGDSCDSCLPGFYGSPSSGGNG